MGILKQSQNSYYNNSSDFGNYQFTSLENIIDAFLVAYVGEEKIINKASRTDVAFHAQRAMQELSFDTFKSIKSQEIEIPPSLTMTLPQDYVNYVKISWSGSDGIKRILYPASKTSNPFAITQNTDGTYDFGTGSTLQEQDPINHESDTWTNYSSSTPIDNQDPDSDNWRHLLGEKYGIDPQHSQINGSFIID